MLKSLSIKNYVLIEDLNFEPSQKFSTITGETGAGKSIILGALGLITGNRADTQVLLDAEQKCIVEAIFNIENYPIKQIFEQNDIDYHKECIIRREIAPTGKSRAFVNDIPVTLNILREITEFLIDIHSQHENYNLLKPEYQLELLDILAQNQDFLNEYKNSYRKLNQLINQLQRLKSEETKNREEYDFIKYQFEELNSTDLQIGEQEQLEQEKKVLENSEDIKRALLVCKEILQASEVNVSAMLAEVRSQLGKIATLSSSFQALLERVNQVFYEIDDIASEVERENDKTEFDPQRLNEVEGRLNLIYTLQHKHRKSSIEELLKLKDEFEFKIQKSDSFGLEIEKLEREIEILHKEILSKAKELSERRKNVIPKLQEQILATLAELGMEDSSFVVSIENAEDITADGIDKVQFLFSANLGRNPAPIQNVASGGEMSRLMLAIKAFMADVRNLPTIIFDEIDTGVSGSIADKVGDILNKISNRTQVLAITHLPQLASKGNKHYKVYKETKSGTTISVLKELEKVQRINEIAAMLSGSQVTEEAVKNAKVLLGY